MASRRRGDDSEEEEATAIDLRQSSSAGPPGAPPKSGSAPAKKPAAPIATARATVLVDDESDEDATEFLSMRPRGQPAAPSAGAAAGPVSSPPTSPPRSASSSPGEPSLRARGRAVPLGGDPPPPPPPAPPPPSAARTQRDSTEPFVDVENLPRAPRPLPQRHSANEESTTGSHPSTASVPRITRIHVVSETESEPPMISISDADDDDATQPPGSFEAARLAAVVKELQKPAPPPDARIRRQSTVVQPVDDDTQAPEGEGDPSITSEVVARPKPPGAAEAGDGILVVEAPADASIVVNGVDRGRGVVRVSGLDRHTRHAVRIHCPGHLPWSGSVTLEGKPAAKIRPTLKPRPR